MLSVAGISSSISEIMISSTLYADNTISEFSARSAK
jgi:hypothetical protein